MKNVLYEELLTTEEDRDSFKDHIIEIAVSEIDNYLDMGCFKDNAAVRPMLIEGFRFGYAKAVEDLLALIKLNFISGVSTMEGLIEKIKKEYLK